jgi:hypothetical protein
MENFIRHLLLSITILLTLAAAAQAEDIPHARYEVTVVIEKHGLPYQRLTATVTDDTDVTLTGDGTDNTEAVQVVLRVKDVAWGPVGPEGPEWHNPSLDYDIVLAHKDLFVDVVGPFYPGAYYKLRGRNHLMSEGKPSNLTSGLNDPFLFLYRAGISLQATVTPQAHAQ